MRKYDQIRLAQGVEDTDLEGTPIEDRVKVGSVEEWRSSSPYCPDSALSADHQKLRSEDRPKGVGQILSIYSKL